MRKIQIKLKFSRSNEVIKIRVEVKKIKTRTIIQKVSETKTWFFKVFSKIDKCLAIGKIQINEVLNEREDITTLYSRNTYDHKRI